MLEFIKMFGLGILYTILSPILLVIFLLFVVYSLFNYLVYEVIYLGGFFMGKRFSVETPLEKKLAQMKKEAADAQAEASQVKEAVKSKEGDLNA